MFKKLLFLHSQLSRTVSQGKWQHRVFLSCSQSGACRAHRRASHAPQVSPKEMPSSHTARPPASTLPVALLSLSTPEPLHPQFYNSLQAYPLQSVHFIFQPFWITLSYPHCVCQNGTFIYFLLSRLAPIIPTYSLYIPKGPHIYLFL